MASRLEARVVGRVQGVGYRFFARRQASLLGLRGHVRNAPDGSVEIVAVGERPALERFVTELERGPLGAYVERVETYWSEGDDALGGFEIRG